MDTDDFRLVWGPRDRNSGLSTSYPTERVEATQRPLSVCAKTRTERMR